MKKESILFYALIIVFVAFILNIFSSSNKVEASEHMIREKIVISVDIKEGDTLWGIASEYYTDEYDDLNEMIDAIKKCNGISDQLKIGDKLLVPCYKVIS